MDHIQILKKGAFILHMVIVLLVVVFVVILTAPFAISSWVLTEPVLDLLEWIKKMPQGLREWFKKKWEHIEGYVVFWKMDP